MKLPEVSLLPKFTKAKTSKAGFLNSDDLKSIVKWTAIFFAAPILMYFGQLSGTLASNHIVLLKDLIPSLVTIGAIEGWALGIVVNYFLKLNDGSK